MKPIETSALIYGAILKLGPLGPSEISFLCGLPKSTVSSTATRSSDIYPGTSLECRDGVYHLTQLSPFLCESYIKEFAWQEICRQFAVNRMEFDRATKDLDRSSIDVKDIKAVLNWPKVDIKTFIKIERIINET